MGRLVGSDILNEKCSVFTKLKFFTIFVQINLLFSGKIEIV